MRKGKFEKNSQRKSFSGKAVSLMMACVLLVGGVVGGTVAWLTDETTEVKNTFSTSNIGVELNETTTDYKMVPGWDIDKNPAAWVTEGSEAAYLFVKIEESENFDEFMTYAIADGWTLYNTSSVGSNIDTNEQDIYFIYREVDTTQMGEENAFGILRGDKVTVKDDVSKDMMDAFDEDENGVLSEEEKKELPTLTFTAYAHQLYKNEGFEKIDVVTAQANLNN